MDTTHLLPPFTLEIANQKAKLIETVWNSKNIELISSLYTSHAEWRDGIDFLNKMEDRMAFVKKKFEREQESNLNIELWGFRNNRMAVRTEYHWKDSSGQAFQRFGNELWEFNDIGLIQKRYSSYNELPFIPVG